VKGIDVEFADCVSNGRDSIDDGRATVDNHDRKSVEVNQTSRETRRGDLHRFITHDHAEHPARADEFVEERFRIHGASIVGNRGCRKVRPGSSFKTAVNSAKWFSRNRREGGDCRREPSRFGNEGVFFLNGRAKKAGQPGDRPEEGVEGDIEPQDSPGATRA
jgi:hypothetical protein